VQLYAPDAGMPMQWRLLSRNNREAGRSAIDYPDPEACFEAIVDLQHNLDALDGDVRRMPSNLWAWQLAKDDTVLVTSGRDYDRMVRCRTAMGTFLRGMREATISRSVLVTNARRWDSRGATL
jgi:hypothetical protein